MKALLVDAGNSRLKWCFLNENKLSKLQHCTYQDDLTAQQCLQIVIEKNTDEIDQVILVSVLASGFIKNTKVVCKKHQLKFNNIVSSKQFAGINNAYDEPHKLGADRFVAMVAAKHYYSLTEKECACIIVDSGTATTIDAIDKAGNHLGGLILPSVNLCSQSLLSNTKQLPLWGNDAQKRFEPQLFAKDTSKAIQSASVLGLAGAVDSICKAMEASMSENTPVLKIICGGGAKIIQPHLPANYELNENLIMLGLKAIVELPK